MKLYSTKHISPNVNFETAVIKGLPDDNGLFMPTEIKKLPQSFFDKIETLTLPEIALEVSDALLGGEIPRNELKTIIENSINFDAPLVQVEKGIYALELFHGPTLAFKDFGARFMARTLAYFLTKKQKKVNILVATSGDTGSAVAQGFFQVPNIEVTILYPKGKVSEIQEKQLTTVGHNVMALEVEGTFDDCQALVKQAFLDRDLTSKVNLSSANSINISRLIPQSFYYFYAYAQLKKQNKPVVFAIPSGNYGNLCGGLIAKKMGLPIHQFIAASNENKVVPKYLRGGNFEPKPSVQTISNAMDVGNPSNFPRIKAVYNNEDKLVREDIKGFSYTDSQTKTAIKQVMQKHNYLCDPHGAVAYLAIKEYVEDNEGKEANYIFLETAHPCKFLDVVEPIIEEKIEIPEHLKVILDQKKDAIPLKNNYNELKEYLLKKTHN